MRIDEWKEGDAINPEYYDRCEDLCKLRYIQRYEQEFNNYIPPFKPIPPPCQIRIVGCFGSRKHDGWYSLSQVHADAFNKYDIPKQVEKKQTILSVIGGLFK